MKIKKLFDQFVFGTNKAVVFLKYKEAKEVWKMDTKFNSILSIVLIPQILFLIIEKDVVGDIEAIDKFYQSKVYELLSEEGKNYGIIVL